MRKKTQPRTRYRLRNWREYNAALVRRGSLTFWVDEAALGGWVARGRPGRRGHPLVYSDAAIRCMLTLKAVFRLTLRGTEGLVRSLLPLLPLLGRAALPAADYTTLSRRGAALEVPVALRAPAEIAEPLHLVVDTTGLKVYGEGEWKVRQHGWTKRRTWRKVHLAVDVATHEVRALAVSTQERGDGEMLPELLAQEPAPLARVTGDGAYAGRRCYAAVAARPERPNGRPPRAVFPPRRERRAGRPPRPDRGHPRPAGRRRNRGYTTRVWQHGNRAAPPLDRDAHVRRIRRVGRRRWEREVGYHQRSLAETAVWRLKALFGDRLSGRRFATQAAEVLVRGAALNRMLALGMPDRVRVDTA